MAENTGGMFVLGGRYLVLEYFEPRCSKVCKKRGRGVLNSEGKAEREGVLKGRNL